MATTDQQRIVGSETSSGISPSGQPFRKPEDVLDRLGELAIPSAIMFSPVTRYHPGARRSRLVTAIVSCSFVWGFGALSIMSSAFTSIDCGNCTDEMLTVVSEVRDAEAEQEVSSN
ncbi:unnamed protein product [Heligmosomoides polygyrus]|uniref:Transmembrane protein n=1 Tax=Heligmosomoides polygyrus TaxID=6339 RepID=A0A183F7C6_HELPZ|nr:unnamed protein product [Heligmosomoides polygyrus]